MGVVECNRLIRLEPSLEKFPENNQTFRNPISRFVCLRAVSPTSSIQYMAWKPGPNSFATDAMQLYWNKMFGFAFLPFNLVGRVINKVFWENVEAMIPVTPTWQTQPCYTLLLRIFLQSPLLLPALPNLLLNPLGEKRSFVKNRSLRLAAGKIAGKPWKWKDFQAMQPNLSPCTGDQVLSQVMNQPGKGGLAGAVNKKFVQFVRL